MGQHICHIINRFSAGGASTVIQNIVNNDPNNRHTICCMEEVIEIDPNNVNGRLVSFNEKHKFDPIALFHIYKFLKHQNIDVLHLHLPYSQTVGRLAAKFSGIPHVISTQHNIPQSHHPVTRYLEFLTRRFDDLTVSVSDGVKEANLRSRENWLCGDNIKWRTIHNTINVSEFNQHVNEADPSKIQPISKYDPVLLNVSRYVKQKSHSDLISVMNIIIDKYPGAHLYFVGRGPLENQIREEVRQKGLKDHITVTGFVTQEELFRYYSLADLFVLSSIREGFGIVLIEAMAAEIPVVATDIPGVNEVVEDGVTGKLVDENAPKQLANAVYTILKEGLGEEYGTNGYCRTLDEFSIEQSVSEYKALYDEVQSNK